MAKKDLLLISPVLKWTQESLIKSSTNRDGLIQQIVTYVRDGHTVTRKQWVRSGFADHAKKDEEEKKKTLLTQENRKKQQEANKQAEENAKQETQDIRAYKKAKGKQLEESTKTGRAHKFNAEQLRKIFKDSQKEMQAKRDAEEDKKKKKARAQYGKQESTRQNTKQKNDIENGKTNDNKTINGKSYN